MIFGVTVCAVILSQVPGVTAVTPSILNLEGSPQDIGIVGERAYIIVNRMNDCGLYSIDVSDPTNTRVVWGVNLSGWVHRIAVTGDYAYISHWNSTVKGILVVNIKNPETPIIQEYFDIGVPIYDLVVDGDLLYTTNSNDRLCIYNISLPSLPSLICNSSEGGHGHIASYGEYLLITQDTPDIVVLNISNPAVPVRVQVAKTLGTYYGTAVTIAGSFAYVVDYNAGLSILDLSNISNVVAVSYVKFLSMSAQQVVVNGNYAYVACEERGLAIVDVSDPSWPVTPTYRYTQDSASGVKIHLNYALVLVSSGLTTLEVPYTFAYTLILLIAISITTLEVLRSQLKKGKRTRKEEVDAYSVMTNLSAGTFFGVLSILFLVSYSFSLVDPIIVWILFIWSFGVFLFPAGWKYYRSIKPQKNDNTIPLHDATPKSKNAQKKERLFGEWLFGIVIAVNSPYMLFAPATNFAPIGNPSGIPFLLWMGAGVLIGFFLARDAMQKIVNKWTDVKPIPTSNTAP